MRRLCGAHNAAQRFTNDASPLLSTLPSIPAPMRLAPPRADGGHDSIFASNVVIVRPYDGQNCQNMWSFVPGHQDVLYNNTCAIWQQGVSGNAKDADMVLTQNDCGACGSDRSATPHFHDNHYYTTHGNASVNCGDEWGTTIADMQAKFADFEARSSWHTLPDTPTVLQWARDVLSM